MLVVGSLMKILRLLLMLIFRAIAVRRLVPARVCNEWSRLRSKDIASVCAPASQGFSHVRESGSGAPLSLPTVATAGFRIFFDRGRALRRMLPFGSGGFMHFGSSPWLLSS